MNFRKDINGLRALAVVAVIIFHFNPAILPGGFAGVDVFFVISGYLMTSIIYRGLQTDQLSLLKFYLARGRRIIPALLPVCLLLLVAGWYFLLPATYMGLAKHVASSLGFVSNIVYWTEAGYFAPGAHEKWLLHTWSLSVEWQFYILYPIVLLLLRRTFGLKALRGFVAVGAILSLGLSIAASGRFPEAAFFLLPTRAWEMMAGGLVLLYPTVLSSRSAGVAELAGALLIFASYVFLSEGDTWPGGLALLPVAGACLVLCANRQHSWLTGSAPSQWLGDISYSLYLWHWPIVVLFSYLGFLSDWRWQAGGVAASLLMAQLSYSLVEQKLRSRTTPAWTWRWSASAALLCAGGMAVFVAHGVVSAYRPISVSDRARFVAEYDEKYRQLRDVHWINKCNMYDRYSATGQLRTDPVCTTKSGSGGVFLWGDSHAEALSHGLRASLPREVPFYQATSAGCRPRLSEEPTLKGLARTACDYSNKFALESIARLQPDVVLVAQRMRHEQTDWQQLAAHLQALGARHVVLVGPVPQWQPSLPLVIVARHWGQPGEYIQDAALDHVVVRTNELLGHMKHPNFSYIPLMDVLCGASGCRARVPEGHALMAVDYGHLSAEGSDFVVRQIILPRLPIAGSMARLP
ncbi:acyltransferase family protein [Oxalobacteraceae bacterium A2-2]